MGLTPGLDFDFKIEDALSISLVFNFSCIFFLVLLKLFIICQKTPENTSKAKGIHIKESQREPLLNKKGVLITITFRITQELLMLITVVFGCVCLTETQILKYPLFFPEAYHIPKLLKLTFNINIGRYLFLSFGNIVMAKSSKFPAIIIHHMVTLSTYIIISGYQQNALLGICGIFMELSTMSMAISRIIRDSKLHARNMYRHYIFILIGCYLTFAFRGVLPITFLTYICSVQNPFRMETIPLVVFFMSVFFFGIINIWMIVQAFITYSQTLEKKKALSFDVRSPSKNPSLPLRTSLSAVTQIGSYLNQILKRKSDKDFLKSTQTDGKKIVFENNLSSKAAQLSEKKVNISLDTKTCTGVGAQQNTDTVDMHTVN